jgi:hypothetical protein
MEICLEGGQGSSRTVAPLGTGTGATKITKRNHTCDEQHLSYRGSENIFLNLVL